MRINSVPPPVIDTSIRCEPASMLFSTNSFTTEAGRSITSPAAIWLIRLGGNWRIVGKGLVEAVMLSNVSVAVGIANGDRTAGLNFHQNDLATNGDRLQNPASHPSFSWTPFSRFRRLLPTAMSRSDFPNEPNPFAFAAAAPRRQQGHQSRAAVTKAVKGFLAVAVVLAALLGARQVSGTWLLSRLTEDFDTLPSRDQQARLIQISGFGSAAIDPLVSALAAKDIATGRTAYDLLRQIQNDWTVLGTASLRSRHATLVHSIALLAPRLPDDRTGWATSLVRQSLMESVDQENDQAQRLYQNANEALGLLAHSNRSGPSILSSGSPSSNARTEQRLVVRSQPLPVGPSGEGNPWTDWPPPTAPTEPAPSIYRSTLSDASARLKPVLRDQTVALKPVSQIHASVPPGLSGLPATQPQATEPPLSIEQVQNTEVLVETALEAYDDRSVMHWLHSRDHQHQQSAKLELLSRGYSESQITQAANLTHPEVKVRLHFLNLIGRHPTLDPRPWLKLMAGDENRDVRMTVVSILASFRDPDAKSQLRTMIATERDQAVASKIRQALNLR